MSLFHVLVRVKGPVYQGVLNVTVLFFCSCSGPCLSRSVECHFSMFQFVLRVLSIKEY